MSRKRAGWIALALGAASLVVASSLLSRREPSRFPVVRRQGKLGPPVDMTLRVLGRTGAETPGGGEIVELGLTVVPGADMEDARIEFVLPRGWEVVSGALSRREDLRLGKETACSLVVRLPPGAFPAAGVRVRARGLSRERVAVIGGMEWETQLVGRLDRDAMERKVRVFPAGEGRR